MRRILRAYWCCLLGIAVLAQGAAYAQQEDRCVTSAPADSMALVALDVQMLSLSWEQIKDSSLVQLITSAGKKEGKTNPVAVASQMLGTLAPMFDGHVVVALADEKPVPKQAPTALFAFPFRERQQALALVMMLQMQLKSEGAQVATRNYNGVAITTFSGGKLKDMQPSYAVLDDRLLLATRPAWLERALDTTAGRSANLTALPHYERLRARIAAMGDGVAWFMMDPKRVQMRAMEASQEIPQPQADNKDKPAAKPPVTFKPEAFKAFLEAYEGAGGRAVLSRAGISVDAVYLINRENEFGRKMLAQKGAPLASAKLVSPNAVFYVGFNNLPFVMDTMRSVMGFMEGDVQQQMSAMSQGIRNATGLDLQTDVLNYIGGEAALVLNEVPADLRSIPALLYVQTNNRAGLGKSLQRLRYSLSDGMGMRIDEKELPEGRLYLFDMGNKPLPISPGWTFANDFLVFGVSSGAMKSPLFLAKGVGTSLAATPAYQQVASVGGDRLLSVFFMNMDKIWTLMDKLPMPKKKAKTPNVSDEEIKRALKTIRNINGVTAMEEDAIFFRVDLGMDLSR